MNFALGIGAAVIFVLWPVIGRAQELRFHRRLARRIEALERKTSRGHLHQVWRKEGDL